MRRTTLTTEQSHRNRRIGRKVLLADRISRAVKPHERSRWWATYFSLLTKKRVAIAGAVIIVVAGAISYGATTYNAQVAAAQKLEAAERQRTLQVNSAEADACRRKKVEQKAELVGKITYDQMYDGTECNR